MKNKFNPLLIILAIIILVGAAYQAGTKNSPSKISLSKPTATTVPPSPTSQLQPTTAFSPTPISDVVWANYSCPFYTLRYPGNWRVTSENKGRKYQDFFAKSLDYKLSGSPPLLESGVEIYVRISDSQFQTIEEEFNQDPLAKSVAQNKTNLSVDGVDAIQYDYNYEGTIATDTKLIKDGRSYTIKLRYADEATKQNYWSIYTSLLSSFRTK